MTISAELTATRREQLLRRALWLAVFTVAWNLAEGAVALAAAQLAGSKALIGFGVDSFVESASAAVLIWRLRVEQADPTRAERAERRALRLIGYAFFALALLVAVESIRALATGARPDTSTIGIVLTAVSLVVMPVLARAKRRVGVELGTRSITADSQQTMACVYLSAIVLVGLSLNAVFGWWWADPVAALAVVAFLVHEGREALEADHVDDCCG
ncbi:cation diffusion facilitator family transporter [Ilumatobacter sp.]|uniref:cation diffusion facilitator family transporter n=1 Tax=Ilumatobacter sp. TaxID=1967498 RepID=UPI003AF6E270